MGSVKDLRVISEPTETKLGSGVFVFSDRYSIFDWGKMPDHIPSKGAALCTMGAWNFERLEEQGVPTHYSGVLDASGKLVRTNELTIPANEMVIYLSRVIEPIFRDTGYDYTFFTSQRGVLNNFVIPLENIYRNGAPKGSSLFRTIERLEKEGKTKELRALLSKYSLTEKPKPGDLFPKTGYDFTTKFEPTDRKVTNKEAYEISGLIQEQFEKLKELRDKTASFVGARAREVGLVDYDGKHEFVFSDSVMLADVAGTLDEDRIMLNGEQVSKELLRQYYKAHDPKWCNAVEDAKSRAKEEGIEDWKSLVRIQPKKLPDGLVQLVGEMYQSCADRYTGLNLFRRRPLELVMDKLRPYTT